MTTNISRIWLCSNGHATWSNADTEPWNPCHCGQPYHRVTDEDTLWRIAETDEDHLIRHLALHAAVAVTLARCAPQRAAQYARIHQTSDFYYD